MTGRNLALHLEKCGDWDHIYAVQRREITFGKGNIKWLPVDLQSKADVAAKFKEVGPNVTHVFFCAFQMTENNVTDVEVNHGMFVHGVEGIEAAGAPLQHVQFVSGTKWYGNWIGPIKTPSREDDPLAMRPMFYYNMEEYCQERVAGGAKWKWASLRPNPVCGFSTGSAMNLPLTLAVYATLCKELKLPFRFPGSKQAYDILLEVVDVDLLAEGMVWLAHNPEACNTSYNISNGDVFRWSEVWPKLAEYWGLPTAEPMKCSLTALMADKGPLWDKIVKDHGLEKHSYQEISTWGFADWVFNQDTDWFSNVNKLRRAGFQGQKLDTAEMFTRQFDQFKAANVFPQ